MDRTNPYPDAPDGSILNIGPDGQPLALLFNDPDGPTHWTWTRHQWTPTPTPEPSLAPGILTITAQDGTTLYRLLIGPNTPYLVLNLADYEGRDARLTYLPHQDT